VKDKVYWVARPDIVVRPEGDEGEVLLFDPETERVKVLNHTGFFVWNLLDGQHTEADVVERLAAEHGAMARDVVTSDVHAFVQDLRDLGFVEAASAP
jgi:hypothetical protein